MTRYWLRHARDGVIVDYAVGPADDGFHTYRLEIAPESVCVYIGGVLRKSVSIELARPTVALHANSRAKGDVVNAQFDYLRIESMIPGAQILFPLGLPLADEFDDGHIDSAWNVGRGECAGGECTVIEREGLLEISGRAIRSYWKSQGTISVRSPVAM